MGILNIALAERAGAHLLIQLYGPPRSGKTYTALRIARGMVGATGKIGMLDTESGRARLYSDKVPGGFVVGELTPPRGRTVRPGNSQRSAPWGNPVWPNQLKASVPAQRLLAITWLVPRLLGTTAVLLCGPRIRRPALLRPAPASTSALGRGRVPPASAGASFTPSQA